MAIKCLVFISLNWYRGCSVVARLASAPFGVARAHLPLEFRIVFGRVHYNDGSARLPLFTRNLNYHPSKLTELSDGLPS